MRALLVFLLGLLCSAVATAQQRHVQFVLDDGLRIEGPVLEFDTTRIVVEVGGEPRTYPTDRIRECRFRVVEDAANAAPAPAGESAADERAAHRPARPVAKPVGAPAASSSAATMRPFRMRTVELQERYPWLVPAQSYQWVSLVVTLFSLLSLFSHFAAKLSGADQPSFGRSMGLAFALLTALGLEFALVAQQSRAFGLAALTFAALVPLMHRSFYRMSFAGSLLASLFFTAQVALAYSVLQLIDTMLRSMGVASH